MPTLAAKPWTIPKENKQFHLKKKQTETKYCIDFN